MGVRNMQEVPAHLETLKSTDGIHRYPTHCIFCEGKERICTNPVGNFYYHRCRSSSKCPEYEERD